MACPTRRAARMLSADPARRENSTFVYHFLENPADTSVSGGGGSCHSCEIPFVFNAAMFLKNTAERDLAVAMARYWVTFADTGKPGQGGAAAENQPEWPAYEPNTEQVMELGHQKSGGVRVQTGLRGHTCDVWDSLPYPFWGNASGWNINQ
jgi:carboxylesterase type B|eukprot:COSAG02_NODE_762_length_17464_cov_12.006219_14_plen_151_part_00